MNPDATAHHAAAHHAVVSSVQPGLSAHVDALASQLAERHDLDVDLARLLVLRELVSLTAAMRQVAVGRAIAGGQRLKDVALASGAKYASAVHKRFVHARSAAAAYRRRGASVEIDIDGWTFTTPPRASH